MKHMSHRIYGKNDHKILFLISTLIICFTAFQQVYGQAETRWLNIGDMQHQLSETGTEAQPLKHQGLMYPGILDPYNTHIARKALWIGAESHTDENGKTYAPRVVHTGPRIFHLITDFYPQYIKLVSRVPEPEVTVDGLKTFARPVFIDEVDPSLKADRLVIRKARTVMGVTLYNEVRHFSNEYHDDYMIFDYVFKNTGNSDNDADIEFPDQTLEDVMIHFTQKIQYNFGEGNIPMHGTTTMSDAYGDGMEDYPVPWRGLYCWFGRVNWDKANSLGSPVWTDQYNVTATGDSSGRLGTPEFWTQTTLHADSSATIKTDAKSQPSVFNFLAAGDPITKGNESTAQDQMAKEYAYMHPEQAYAGYGYGTAYPHHADLLLPSEEEYPTWEERVAHQPENMGKTLGGNFSASAEYGPYTLEPGDSIRIVFVEGFAGLSQEAAWDIGVAYKESGGDDDLLIEYQGEKLTKNRWFATGRDSLWKMLARAEANYKSGYAVPHPPDPPSSFQVTSGTDRIVLDWTSEENPPGGFEIYRTHNRYQGAFEDKMQYNLVATVDPDVRHYEDTEVTRGISYFYYIQSVGAINTNSTGETPTGVRLKSNRFYTQTYDPAFLRRAAGDKLSDARIVPNPYNITSAKEVRWPDQQDKLGFLNIPGKCTIEIYTELGELIETIEHTDGSGDEFWDHTSYSNQVVVSGIYFAIIKEHETGNQIIKKFVIIR